MSRLSSAPGKARAETVETPDAASPNFAAASAEAAVNDRIFLSNYVIEVEIGAYQEEFGIVQRLQFDVVLEVARSAAHLDDRVGRVINYDDLLEAIHRIAEGERITLLETYAERLASSILIDPRARRAHIKIQKLDRLPNGATLGVEIVRVRAPEANETVWALAPELS